MSGCDEVFIIGVEEVEEVFIFKRGILLVYDYWLSEEQRVVYI